MSDSDSDSGAPLKLSRKKKAFNRIRVASSSDSDDTDAGLQFNNATQTPKIANKINERRSDSSSDSESERNEPTMETIDDDPDARQNEPEENLFANSEAEEDAPEHEDGGGADEAEEAPEARRVAPKKVILNPQPKLNAERLLGPRGLVELRKLHSTIHFKGKGYEEEDISNVLSKMKLWANRLFPRLRFENVIERCETLGTKMPVQTHLKKMRLGWDMHDGFNAENIVEQHEEHNTDHQTSINDENLDPFEALIREQDVDNTLRESDHADSSQRVSSENHNVSNNSEAAPMDLPAEVLERIQRNKELALQRRLQRSKMLNSSDAVGNDTPPRVRNMSEDEDDLVIDERRPGSPEINDTEIDEMMADFD